MTDKEPIYNVSVSWKQPYTEWIASEEAITEIKVEHSELAEAKAVIDRIRAMK